MKKDLQMIGKFIIVSGLTSLCVQATMEGLSRLIFKTGDIKSITIKDIVGD